MLELNNICLSFEGRQVLKDFNFKLEKGERIALMGPSGAGKTSILRIVAGLLKPDSGEMKNTFNQISFMFQEPRLLPWATALENVNLVLSDHKTTRLKAEEYLIV